MVHIDCYKLGMLILTIRLIFNWKKNFDPNLLTHIIP